MKEIKPFTLYYFILRMLAISPKGLDLGSLRESLSAQENGKPIGNGSLYGTLSKLKASGLIQTTIDIVLIEDNEEPVKKYMITSKGKIILNNSIDKINTEHREISKYGINGAVA